MKALTPHPHHEGPKPRETKPLVDEAGAGAHGWRTWLAEPVNECRQSVETVTEADGKEILAKT